MPRTATTSNAILGLLELRPSWSAYELTKQLRRNMRFFWPRAESRIYAELRHLVSQGAASEQLAEVRGRNRTVYTITPLGLARLHDWLETAPRGLSFENEPILRIMLGDLAGPGQLRAATAQVRADAEAVLAVGRVVSREYLRGSAPFQDDVHLRALVFDFLSSHALMMLAWVERTDALLAQWPSMSDENRTRRALELIGERAAMYPHTGTREDDG